MFIQRFSVRAFSIIAITLLSLGLLSACRDGGDSVESLTEDENDIRVGRETVRCGVPQAPQEVVENIIEIVQLGRSSTFRAQRGAGSITVPIIFHVIASGPSAAEGNVPDSQLLAQVDVMNSAFAASGTAFRFVGAGVSRNIDPVLAQIGFGSEAEQIVKGSLRQGDASTLNVYVANPTDGLLGYATFPWSFESDPTNDGVVISFQTLPGGAFTPYDRGITLVHEVGHWLGLLHTFQDSCSATNDTISDTPPEDLPAYGCPEGRNTCFGDGDDPVRNYMDYSDDLCLTNFTPEQSARMDFLSQTFRGL